MDNAHAGGAFISISNTGKLLDTSYAEYQKQYTEHPDTHVVFEGYQLPLMAEILEA